MMLDFAFRKQVKDALEHLYDTAYLETHPLLSQIDLVDNGNRVTRAQKLRSLLKDLIETLRPQQESASAPEGRCYRAMRYRYIQGMSTGQVESELGISLRQLQREIHKGLDAVAMLLWERKVVSDAAIPAFSDSETNEVQELQEELNQWVLDRHAYEIQVLLDDVVWMMSTFMNQHQTQVKLNLPGSLPLVMVDPTLTRQAFFKLLRSIVQKEPGEVQIDCQPAGNLVEIKFSFPIPAFSPDEANWQITTLLVTQQGGRLLQAQVAGQTQITVALPRSEQKTVLVVDDNAALHQLFERYLAPSRYTVIHAFNGQEALQLAEANHPDFITLDVMMAAMDGWQVLRSLKRNQSTAEIPVIVCSVVKEPELALSLGAKAYLKKPVERLKLQETLERLQQAGDVPSGATSESHPDS